MAIFSLLHLPEVSEVFRECLILLMEAWKIPPWNLNNNSNVNPLVDTQIYSYDTKNLENAVVPPYKITEHLKKIRNLQQFLVICREPIKNYLSVCPCAYKIGQSLEEI